jgi:hypothetical protein
MKHINRRVIFVNFIVVIVGWTAAVRAADATVADQMIDVIGHRVDLEPDRRELLIAAVREELADVPDLGQDKTAHAKEHLSVYLDDILGANSKLNSRQFQVVVDTLNWNLHNYAALPPIDEMTRTADKERLQSLSAGIRDFVNKAYVDTPADEREQLIKREGPVLAGMAKKAGNYFYPECLYPSSTPVTGAWVVEQLSRAPFLQNVGTRYARISAIMADESLPLKSRQCHIRFFLNDESFNIKSSIMTFLPSLFDLSMHGAYKAYVRPPVPLMAEYQKVGAELMAQANKEIQELPQRAAHAHLVEEVLRGTGITVTDGTVNIPNEIPDDLAGVKGEHLTPAMPLLTPPTFVAVGEPANDGIIKYLPICLVGVLIVAGVGTALLRLSRRRSV